MTCRIGKNSITCIRGSSNLSRMKSVVEDTKGTQWYCEFTKEQLDMLGDMNVIDVFNDKGQFKKKFIKSYLTHITDVPKD